MSQTPESESYNRPIDSEIEGFTRGLVKKINEIVLPTVTGFGQPNVMDMITGRTDLAYRVTGTRLASEHFKVDYATFDPGKNAPSDFHYKHFGYMFSPVEKHYAPISLYSSLKIPLFAMVVYTNSHLEITASFDPKQQLKLQSFDEKIPTLDDYLSRLQNGLVDEVLAAVNLKGQLTLDHSLVEK